MFPNMYSIHDLSKYPKINLPICALAIFYFVIAEGVSLPMDLDFDLQSLDEKTNSSVIPNDESGMDSEITLKLGDIAPIKENSEFQSKDEAQNSEEINLVPDLDTKDFQIRSVGPITPFREKSLINENLTAPLPGLENKIRMASYWETLSNAQTYRSQKEYQNAIKTCITLLEQPTPDEINRLALIELAYNLQENNDLQKSFQVLSQYLVNYPKAENIPEVYLSQGKILRKLGAQEMAIGKFYSAMSSTLSVENSTNTRYKRINLIAQTEIADTYYNSGDYSNAIRTFQLILKGDKSLLELPLIEFKLIKSKIAEYEGVDALNAINSYLDQYPNSKYAPEAQFIKITQLLELKKEEEFMTSVLDLLRSSSEKLQISKNKLVPWQKRSGNLLANYLFEKKDYSGARAVYKQLQKMDSNPGWYIPATYRLAQCNERLDLPSQATDGYMEILSIGNRLGEDQKSIRLKTILELSDFRIDQIAWLSDARDQGRALLDPSSPPGKSQQVDEEKNSKWLAETFSRVDINSTARILSKLEATETSSILKHLTVSEQAEILRKIGSLGQKEKSLASIVATTLELPEKLTDLQEN